MKKKTAIIFAGGKSSRMGRDKALLPFGGVNSLAEYQYRRLCMIFDRVYISAKSNKFNFDVDIIEDCYNNSSPLVALVSVFKRLNIDEIFVLSVDSPFIDFDTVDRLYSNSLDSKDVIVAKSPYGVEPLCAIYKKTVFLKAKELLAKNNHRLQSLLDMVDTQYIEFSNSDIFTNLNYSNEYKIATKIWDVSYTDKSNLHF